MDKILKLQSEIGALAKTETNPFFKSKYFDVNSLIAQLMPLLEKYKLVVIQPLSHIDGKPAITTTVYSTDSDSSMKDRVDGIVTSTIPLPENSNPQQMGSAITYYRRYALQSLFLLQAEDDDANHASKPQKSKIGLSEAILDEDIGF